MKVLHINVVNLYYEFNPTWIHVTLELLTDE